MATLDPISTNEVAKPILKPLIAEDVVASVGHIPNINTKIGFSVIKPLSMILTFELLIVLFFADNNRNKYIKICNYLIYI